MKFTLSLTLLAALLSPSLGFASPSHWTLDLTDEENAIVSELQFQEATASSWPAYFQKRPALKKMKLGIRMEGSQALSRNETEVMVPASIQKIFTAAAALKYLGPDFQFENSFRGNIDRSGAALLRPEFRISGDPTWAHEAFEGGEEREDSLLSFRMQRVIDGLTSSGIRKVRGPIKIQSLRPGLSQFQRPEGWRESWSLECMAMMQTDFQANGNCGLLKVKSATNASWVTEGVSIPIRYRMSKSREGANSVRVTPVFDSRGLIREYVLSGFFSKGPVFLELPVHQGAEWLRNLFVLRLQGSGIEYEEGEGEAISDDFLRAFEIDLSSRPMIEILNQAVQYSINGVMDRIYLELGFQADTDPGRVIESMIRDLVPDSSLLSGIRIEDGSGLNLFNRTRADLLYGYLSQLRFEPYFPLFFSTLAVAGKSGTLLNRSTLVASGYTYGRVFAKTGTLNRITNLAGYFKPGPEATPEPFVVLSESDFSSATARPLIDGVVVNFAAQNSTRAQD